MSRRIERINSLLREVISEVINREVKNPHLPKLITITHVDITRDLRLAKVYVSVIGDELKKKEALKVLQSASGFIGVHASKKVVMRYFPELTFILDDALDKYIHIENLIGEIEKERKNRE